MTTPNPDPLAETIRAAIVHKLRESVSIPSVIPGEQPRVIGPSDHELAEFIAAAVRTHLDRPEPGPALEEAAAVATADQFAQRWNNTPPEGRQAFVDGYRKMADAHRRDMLDRPEWRLNGAWWLGAEFAWDKSCQGFNAEMEAGQTFHSLFRETIRSPYLLPEDGTPPRLVDVIVHEIAKDGLPDMDKTVGRVAFIFDGCVVSGWPLAPHRVDDDGNRLWEGDRDVAHHRAFSGVTHWLEFPQPAWMIERRA